MTRFLSLVVRFLTKSLIGTIEVQCVLFGDGAGAAVVQATDEPKGILASYIGSDGDYADIDLLGIPAGGSRMPVTQKAIDQKLDKIQMNGRRSLQIGCSAHA